MTKRLKVSPSVIAYLTRGESEWVRVPVEMDLATGETLVLTAHEHSPGIPAQVDRVMDPPLGARADGTVLVKVMPRAAEALSAEDIAPDWAKAQEAPALPNDAPDWYKVEEAPAPQDDAPQDDAPGAFASWLAAHRSGKPAAASVQVGGTHYKDMAIQPFEYIHANGLGFAEGAVVKYVSRWRAKGGLEDLRKARHFLDLLIEAEERAAVAAEGLDAAWRREHLGEHDD